MSTHPRKEILTMAGLYVHVPFCRSKCAYCDFYSLPRIEEFSERYIMSLVQEWRLRQNEVKPIETVYFGGGTPSVLTSLQIDFLHEGLNLDKNFKEFTVEVNPEDVTEDIVEKWKAIGANRISLGLQSLNDKELSFVGRRHTAEQALRSFKIAREIFDNISVDLILGLPFQSKQSLEESIRTILSLNPEHISTYILGYEPGTRLYALRSVGRITETDDSTIAGMYEMTCELLGSHGYEHYEISNFALPRKRAIHNSSYWANIPYLGLGPGAHSFDGQMRRFNPSDIKTWLNGLENGRPAFITENENKSDKINNIIMTRLRTAEGLDLNVIDTEYRDIILTEAKKIRPEALIIEDNYLRIPEKGWLVSDDTIAKLFVE